MRLLETRVQVFMCVIDKFYFHRNVYNSHSLAHVYTRCRTSSSAMYISALSSIASL